MKRFRMALLAVFFHYIFRPVYQTATLANIRIKYRLMICRQGCENCWSWKCSLRYTNETPYNKFRRGRFRTRRTSTNEQKTERS